MEAAIVFSMRTLLLAPLALLVLPLSGCGPKTGGQSGAEELEEPDAPNLPGDPGASEECTPQGCETEAEAELDRLAEAAPPPAAFTSSSCSIVGINGERLVRGSACECHGADGDRVVGPVGLGCFAFGRTGDCLFDDSEFSGCSVTSPESCDAVCSELYVRMSDDAAATHQTSVVRASCIDEACQRVVNVDGQCFANRSYEVGRAYDCSQEPEQILASERDASDPLSALSEVPTESGSYVEGTSGFAAVVVSDSYSGTFRNGPYFGVSAQFFHTTGSESFEFGEVLDPLEGVDDCGRVASAGFGASNVDTDFFAVDKAELIDGQQRYLLEEFDGGSDFFSYGVDLTNLDVEPRFRQRYGLYAEGGELTAPLEVDDLLLPEALAFPELRELSHAPRADLHLTWTGHGDAPLKLMLFVTAEPGPFLGPFELHCLLQDDGEFTLKQELFEDAPDGVAQASFSRVNRFVDRSGEQSLLTDGRIEVSHRFAFGEECDNAAVLEACHAFAEHYASENTECGGTYEQPLDERCPQYLATSCTGCVEYYDCLVETTSCEDGTLNSDVCSCPG